MLQICLFFAIFYTFLDFFAPNLTNFNVCSNIRPKEPFDPNFNHSLRQHQLIIFQLKYDATSETVVISTHAIGDSNELFKNDRTSVEL